MNQHDAPTGNSPEGGREGTSFDVEHIRGSSILLSGRVFALLLTGVTQVLIVRYLTKSDYGAFAYGLAVASFVELLATLVHRQSLTRFLSLYEDRHDYDKLFGTIVMVLGLIVAVTCVLFAGALVFRTAASHAVGGTLVMRIVLIMFAVGALEAIDDVLEGMFAVLSRPRTIFFRKYLLAPGIQLGVAIAVVVGGFSVSVLAVAVVAGWALAVGIYFAAFVAALRERGLLQHFRFRTLSMPFTEVFGFGIPLITTQLVFLCTDTISVLLLGKMRGTTEVANLRVVLPLAGTNQLVIFTFTLLFMPMAARLFAQRDTEAMSRAYWQSAIWLAVLSFPMFALTGPLARPVTVFLFGHQYRSSASVLSLLAIGMYFSAALGFNALTLQTYGRLKFVAGVNLVCVALCVGLMVVLIPPYGAVGVAIASCATLVVQNAANQLGMRREIGIPVLDPSSRSVYATIIAVSLGLWAIEIVLRPGILLAGLLAVLATVLVVRVNRRALHAADAFPEIARIPLIGALLK